MFRIVLCLLFLCLNGCVKPAQHFDEIAKAYGFSRTVLTTMHFKHKIYSTFRNGSALKAKSLHIYLDGDGTPWEHEQWLAEDPTARDPLILRLMRADSAPSILLGRPCYYGLNKEPDCHFKYWTSHRYAQIIVDSLVAALQTHLKTEPAAELVLIGYSGGGTLAMLMAPQLTNLHTIITLAANLDTDAWSQLHGYPPLIESLNPADLAPLNLKIKQFHFAGGNDNNVPASIIKTIATKQNAYFQVIEKLTHNGCWECVWPDLLNQPAL